MTKPFLRPGVAVLAASLSLALAPSAGAAAVFGGTTSADEPIVLRSDAKAKTLRSLVLGWKATCTDGMYVTYPGELLAVRHGNDDNVLVTSRNGKGRFAGTQSAFLSFGDQTGAVTVEISGRLRPRRAAGTLSATVLVFDAAGVQVDTCKTDRLAWSARRDPKRLYGGRTTQDEPVIIRLDRSGKRVAKVNVGWHTESCRPPDYRRSADELLNFPIRGGRYGDAWDDSFGTADDKFSVHYDINGTVRRRSTAGALSVQFTETDAAGTVKLTCDSGTVRWRATTG
jgi:hypothetical protein